MKSFKGFEFDAGRGIAGTVELANYGPPAARTLEVYCYVDGSQEPDDIFPKRPVFRYNPSTDTFYLENPFDSLTPRILSEMPAVLDSAERYLRKGDVIDTARKALVRAKKDIRKTYGEVVAIPGHDAEIRLLEAVDAYPDE